ncbi:MULTISPECIES: T6SS phospholipase effector Tle1-like catalytic domain-containing protein [Bradyrhizobium]|uniref:T6SS phospholipase effector Tle1-like catalytic domain-containing protein n=1 Tax=Bradyrhizobium TaxID=374 RepID=UPI000231BD20|nr:DUF2235 domain-containing protein [Bradyrhizobium japonicum]AJA59723.1 hypothetical protein RN69_04305 [Bradyrhizobium japonicum]KMJ97870.1 hypothetical protein CF64_20565 [Bradyrhizobium japonicum]MCS3535535.1 uncharacterized protein (DUF2235 family) [Bradyrhizobium japonicum]MCS3988365.1 uncharacterized protein (DUF2235 family) [Bradyrhizobium japonicum]MCS4016818.1 uncharacterized protein (DUF2235 family) [Bradyrhizobium japonicum]
MARTGGFRHLIYFIDGTWLWAGSDSNFNVYSNIYRLNTLLSADDENGRAQIIHYSRGLGSGTGKAKKWLAGAFSFGIDELVADLYVNICSNFERGDKIYIFGFSRGAVVARALTGLLSHGILKAHHINRFSQVWASYVRSGEILPAGQSESTLVKLRSAAEGKLDDKSFSDRTPRIEFVGLFDTVSGGHGPSEIAQQLRLSTGLVQPNVKHAVHLLSIDETRLFFKPVYWAGLGSSPNGPTFRTKRTLEQIWMPGVHSDVGGTYGERHLGNLALLTMIDRVIARTELFFDLKEVRKLQILPESGDPIRVHDEFNGTWRLWSDASPRLVDRGVIQAIHPFAKKMTSLPVNYKDKANQDLYRLSPEFSSMNEAEEFLSGHFKGAY